MYSSIQLDISRNKERLEYYLRLKSAGHGSMADKWIAIYEERLLRLEKQAQKEAKKLH